MVVLGGGRFLMSEVPMYDPIPDATEFRQSASPDRVQGVRPNFGCNLQGYLAHKKHPPP